MAGVDHPILLQKVFHIEGGHFTDAGSISSRVKRILKGAGFSNGLIRRASIATFEAEMNVICYADQGNLSLFITRDFLKIVVEDRGVGIPDIALAMTEGYSTADEKIHEMGFGAGLGLSNIKRNTDEMILTSALGEGTHLEFKIALEGEDRSVSLPNSPNSNEP